MDGRPHMENARDVWDRKGHFHNELSKNGTIIGSNGK